MRWYRSIDGPKFEEVITYKTKFNRFWFKKKKFNRFKSSKKKKKEEGKLNIAIQNRLTT